MIQNSHYTDTILSKFEKEPILQFLTELLAQFSVMFISAKPHAYDSTELSQIYSSKLIEANEAVVDDFCHKVDVVLESYKKEIVNKILRIFNILSESKGDGLERRLLEQISHLKEIYGNSSPKSSEEFVKILQGVVIKWVNFEDEFEASSEIFETLLQFDGKYQELQVLTTLDENPIKDITQL